MPHYTFALKDGSHPTEDGSGARLPGREEALAYAHDVAFELMRGREEGTRSWRLDVYEDGDNTALFEIPFASIDHTLDHLVPETRQMMVDLGERRRLLMETIQAMQRTAVEARALIRLSKGKPYLATHLGERTIRER